DYYCSSYASTYTYIF
nr:immunoglobulin light chain junction region [Macaca mulatta]MOX44387.1 immunoglobulin light chain junction region [Macaca mulatta]MOX44690.1 immunoglobulin light chain junction region [Macaca mulatta]MOX45572.1 immunoglobulin light chain junction region [Macaca mulatta]MOX47488.1 immunoglobulin light chain junction region [Macaca mulatta]